MKLELKNIKHTEWASEETHCYQALYLWTASLLLLSATMATAVVTATMTTLSSRVTTALQ